MTNTDSQQIPSAPAPFTSTYTPQLPELLTQLKSSLLLSTYQAGKLVVVSPQGSDSLTVLPRTFEKPMGIAIEGTKMAVACKDHVLTLENVPQLAGNFPKKPGVYDAMWLPRMTYHTGIVDMHDIAFGKDALWAINTSFSCLCKLTGHTNFEPVWKPSFITDLEGEDRCHLNGLVMEDGQPRYVTALGKGDKMQSWRESIVDGGILIDLKTDEILFEGLAMPHSPMTYKGQLYGLLSAAGQLVHFDIENKKVNVIKELGGFCRGMDVIGDYAFIGMSKLRKNSSTFAKLDIANMADSAGIKIVHLPSGSMAGELTFKASVDEIYEVKVMPNMLRPNILSNTSPLHNYSLTIPGKVYWADKNHEIFK